MAQTKETLSGGELPSHEQTEEPTELDREQIFEILSNQRRRYVIHYLKQRSGESDIPLREVVDQVAAWENNTQVGQLRTDDRKTVYTALKQTHLPRLNEFGVVDYDQQRGEVTLDERAEQVQLYMEYVPEGDITWSQYYIGLSGVWWALTVGAWVGVPLLASANWLAVSVLFAGTFTLSSLAHFYIDRQSLIGSDGPPRETEYE